MLRRGAREANGQKGKGGGRRLLDDEELEEQDLPDNVECEQYDEEDVYVMIQLPPGFDGDALLSASTVEVEGIGTSNPKLRVGDEVFKGKTEPIVGTSAVFKTPPPGASGSQSLELACYSSLRMNFNSGERRRKKPKR